MMLNLNTKYMSMALEEEFALEEADEKEISAIVTVGDLVNYIQTERINTACSLLLNTDLSVSDIAAQTGYDNFAYFSKAFRKHTGETPSSYRKGQ